MSPAPFEYIESLRIGTVDFVSPDEIKVALDIEAPESVALNAGGPRPFPRVNGYVLIPVDDGYLVGQIEWLTVERSAFPKRRGMQDFGLVDLPYPLRKMSLNPLGTLRKTSTKPEQERYAFRRGADALPSIGTGVLLPTDEQLRSIVESGERKRVKIGTSPLAGNAEVCIDPDRLFGRHLAVLGNTGSGKSCSVAGLIRWSLQSALAIRNAQPNCRFIVLDPNGEYSRAFEDAKPPVKARIFKVRPGKGDKALQVPLWFWNSAEWSAFTNATVRTQKPILQNALRLRRNAVSAGGNESVVSAIIVYLQGAASSIRQEISNNSPFAATNDGRYWRFIELLKSISASLSSLSEKEDAPVELINTLVEAINELKDVKSKNDRNYNKPFEYGDVDAVVTVLGETIATLGGEPETPLPLSEDTPLSFRGEDLLTDLDFLATNSGNRQWFEFFLTRVRTMLSDTTLKSIVGDQVTISLGEWLSTYVGSEQLDEGSIVVIDLSLVPSDVIHILTSVIARIVFESLQRYRSINGLSLPTVLVMEEAHTFIKRYSGDGEHFDGAAVCCQVFERIAREGRKFGLGLVLSSQRPSELSPTVLSQCNSFLLHRISNDQDQKLVHSLVPDNLKGLLRELPSLPSQNAILLGWASELPLLVKMNDLPKSQQPRSDDPDFWDVWTGVKPRPAKWKPVVDDWQSTTSDLKATEPE
ncbi:MAG TPA: DUF87 domain-containing protein [Bryobacteraceae bacterium]|jgi:hypothetical protein